MTETDPTDGNYTEKIEKMVALTVAAARGIIPLAQVALPLAQISHSHLAPPAARHLAGALSRILAGERDPAILQAGLPPELVRTVQDVLAQIEAPEPASSSTDRIGVTFEQLIEKVAEACTGELMLWQSLWNLTGELAADESLPPDIRTLGETLRKILAGERQKHILAGLTPEHRWAVEQLLDWLAGRAVEPDI